MVDATLESWVNINSGSNNAGGLRRMADALAAHMAGLPGTLERIPLPAQTDLDGTRHQPGDVLRLRFRPEAPVQVLFSGHMDTVFGPEHPFQKLRVLPDGRWNGPGVADMKGGLYILLESVRRFLREDRHGVVGGEILINADEEVGSLGSHALILEAARRAHVGLVFESALPSGELVRTRKGTGTFRVRAHGKAAHTGRDFEKGRNAVVAMADFMLACHALNGRIDGAIINVGPVKADGPVNVVPDFAEGWLNVRIGRRDSAAEVDKALHDLAERTCRAREGIRIELAGGFTRAPTEETPANAALHALWNRVEADLGLALSGKRDTGGSSDGNILGEAGLPHLDGVGVKGGSIHSDEEFIIPGSIPEQIAKTVAFLSLISAQPDCLSRCALAK